MKQWLVRRGLLVTLPLATIVAFGLDACSSEPNKPGTGETAKSDSPAETQQSEPEQEIAPSTIARDRLSRLTQFTRVVRVAKQDELATPGTRSPAKLDPAFQARAQLPSKLELKQELRAVVPAGEEQRFLKRGNRIRAELKATLKDDTIRPATVDLPTTSEGFVRVQAAKSKFGVEFAAKGGKAGVPFETADGLVNYPGGAPGGGDMVLRVGRETVEDFVVLEAKPEHAFIDYRVKVGEIAGLRLYDEILEFVSASGNPEVRVSPPEVVDADGKAHHAKLELLDCAFDSSPAAAWDRPVTAPGASECTVRVSWDDSHMVYPAIVDPVWSSGGTLAKGRYRNAAVKMSNGNVITCGGLDINGDALKTCEVYSAGAGTWSTGPAMTTARNFFTLIAIGTDVLAVGDYTSATSELCNCTAASPAWGATGTNFATGSFNLQSLQPVLTADGKFVVVFDYNGKPFQYSVAGASWSAGPSNTIYRQGYVTIAVPSGTAVLRCDGIDNSNLPLKTCEKYTPAAGAGTWIMPGSAGAAPNTVAGRYNPAFAGVDATRVVLYGGYNYQNNTNILSAEIYNSTTNTWTDTNVQIPNSLQEYEVHNTWAIHGGTGKVLTASSYYPTLFNPTDFSWSQINTYDGVTNFYTMGTQAAVVPVANKVLLVPVSPNGNYAAQTTCKLFDFVGQGGTCQPNQPGQASDCKSGLTCYYDSTSYTQDGLSVCCDTTCTDPCYSCRAPNKESGTGEGTCGPRKDGLYINTNTCPYDQQSTCGNVGNSCDGKGACKKYDTSNVCGYGSCADGTTQNNQRNCDGKGACAAATTTTCATGYACNYGQCLSQCYDDSYCASNYYCQYWASPAATANQCLPRKTNGKACSNNSTSECATGYCVDNVCCNTACNGLCEACTNALTGQTNGACKPIPNGTASGNDCKDAGAASCGQTGVCNGASACQKYAAGTLCADQTACASETARFVPDQCDGTGTCTDKGTQNCNAGYSCQAGVCNTTCTADANCASAYFCDTVSSTCVLDHKQSQTCKSDRQCEGNVNCVDGVCCDSQCTGTCRSCLKNRTGLASDGICGNSVDDTDPDNECAIDVGYPASCKAPGLCNGAGTCRVYAKPGIAAKTDTCSGTTVSTYTCDGAGNLTQIESPCYPYKCNAGGTACRVACTAGTAKTDCDDSSFCQDGKCVGVLPQGSACTDGGQCKSGFCADQHSGALEGDPAPEPGAGGDSSVDPIDHPGVCCDTACGSQCEGCKKSTKGQGSDGTCGKVADHTDLKNDCQSDPNNACGHNGECDGNGACRNVPSGSSCGVSNCVGNSARGQVCDGQGACVNDSAIACAPYVCRDVNGAQQCTNPCADDNDCQDGYYCVETACKKKLAAGAVCESSAICASNFCVDGVCCDVSCKGQCEACDVAGSEGVCSPTQGVPHGNRPVCDHAGEECGGQCDGVNSAACKYAAVGTTCGSTTCNNDLASSSECNGQGECKANKDTECSPYTCGTDDTCLSRCEQDADCSQGYACDETTQRCLPSASAATCSEDRQSSQGQNGISTPCKPFLCVPASGTCALACAFTTDCAPDFVCEPSTKTCLPAPTGSGGDDTESCACRAAGSTPNRSGYWALAAFGVALSGLRRRRRAKKSALTSAKPARFAQVSQPLE